MNNRPGGKRVGEVNVGREQWATFDVTKTVQSWAGGTKKNYGPLHAGFEYLKKVDFV